MKDLNVGAYEALMKGGESGPVVVPGKPDESRLYQLIQEGKMPMGKQRLAEKDIAAIRAWIENGARACGGTKRRSYLAQPARRSAHPAVAMHGLSMGLRHRKAGRGSAYPRRNAQGRQVGRLGDDTRQCRQQPDAKENRFREMPPKKGLLDAGVKPVTSAEIEKISNWIDAGAPEGSVKPDVATTEPDPLVSDKDRQFWAFQPPRASKPPKVSPCEPRPQSDRRLSAARSSKRRVWPYRRKPIG